MNILAAILTLSGLGIIFGVGLALAARKFCVEINPRIEKILHKLPGSNCGACGEAGCLGFAEGLLSGKFSVDACRVSEEETKEQIAKLLGKKLEKKVKKIAILHCNGGIKIKDRYNYQGIKDCAAANLLLAGQKECVFGCLGFGSCKKICPFGAIKMSEEGLPIIDKDKCKACNICVLMCPKKLFTLIPITSNAYVSCGSHDLGKDTKVVCPVGCVACGLCKKVCKLDAIQVIDNLAVIDYYKCTSCGDCVKVCPVKCIITRE